jgi:ABC-type branched-subunit amino acid transport system ATPase component
LNNQSNHSSMIEFDVRDIGISFGGLAACSQTSFTANRGEVTSIIGPNGAGKTTLFNILSGIYAPTSGEILYRGEHIEGLAPHEIAQKGIIRTFQGAKIIKRLSVLDNLLLAAQGNPGEHLWSIFTPGARKRFEAEQTERAMELLERVGLTRLANEYGGILSGGQRKLVDLARSMMARPTALLLDEPFAGVNPTLVEKLVEVLNGMKKEHNVTIMLIEHDLETVMSISDKVIVMSRGTPIAEGLPGSIYENNDVIEAYLGSRRGA